MKHFLIISLLGLLNLLGCAQERPFFLGYIQKVSDAALVSCDPYNLKVTHTCLVIASAFQESLYVYDATAGELVLAPNKYFPLKVKVAKATNQLIPVESNNESPILLALDQSGPYLFAIRLFADKNQPSFRKPYKYPLNEAPFAMAAALFNNEIVAIATYPLKKEIRLMLLDKETGAIKPAINKSITLGNQPSQIAIDHKSSKAVILDAKDAAIYTLDLAHIMDVINNISPPTIETIPLSTAQDRIFLSHRDLGQGEHLYALTSSKKDITLINMASKSYGQITLDEEISALYFPGLGSSSCCKDNKEWALATTIKGNMYYLSLKDSSSISLEKISTLDLKKEENLSLKNVLITKIVGGFIKTDSSIKKETLCKSNREVFFMSQYANQRISLKVRPEEVEGSGLACEGDEAVSRFGVVR
jgi:hypothetical protein